MEDEVTVLVVGGSLVGLSASVLLGHHGVRHMVVERHRGTAIHPRAAAFHQRTLEIFRSVGLQRHVEDAAAREFVQDGAIMAVESLGGRELAWFYRSVNEGVEDLSPARRLFITQIGLEPVLRARASEVGADLRFATDLADFEQDGDGIVASLRCRDSGETRRVRARIMIAADGAHSPVRRKLAIPLEGHGDISQCATIYFKADVRSLLGGRNLSVVYVNQPGLLAFFRFSFAGDAGFLAVFAAFDAEGRRRNLHDDAILPEEWAALVRQALGVGRTFPVSVENVQPWTAAASTAAAFRSGSVFLAGDAAHVMPPTGGFGGNTGVADVHNLAWKIAMVASGQAGEGLLESYDEERRPIADLTVKQALRRYVERVEPSLGPVGLEPNVADTAIELGGVYRSRVIASDEPGSALTEAPETPSGRPGTRLAHRWLDESERVSTLDCAGRAFALLAGPQGAAWLDAARSIDGIEARDLLPAEVAAAVGIAATGAMLVRPDGVIGWRGDRPSADPGGALQDAVRLMAAR